MRRESKKQKGRLSLQKGGLHVYIPGRLAGQLLEPHGEAAANNITEHGVRRKVENRSHLIDSIETASEKINSNPFCLPDWICTGRRPTYVRFLFLGFLIAQVSKKQTSQTIHNHPLYYSYTVELFPDLSIPPGSDTLVGMGRIHHASH